MQSVRRIILASLLAVLLLPPAARAGGWWSSIEIDRTTVAAGQSLEARAAVLFRSIEAADEATDDTTFYAYALQGLDYSTVERAMSKPLNHDWWSLGDAEAVQLAPLVVRVSEANLGRARASFTMPELASGSYALMFCDAGCAHPLGDVVPTMRFRVVADPATARLVERTDRLQARVRRQARSLAIAGAAARSARRAATETSLELDAIEERLGAVRRLVREDNASGLSPRSVAGWLVGGVLIGMGLLVLIDRRRSRRRPAEAFGGWLPSDEELSNLIASERANPLHSCHLDKPEPHPLAPGGKSGKRP